MPVTAPYGSWKSPISVETLTAHSIGLSQPWLDEDDLYWLESRPQEAGRVTLMRRSANGQVQECLASHFNVRTRVHEYGGGAYAVFQRVIYFVNFRDQRLYRLRPGEEPQPLTPEGYRYADFCLDSAHQRLICVREDHSRPGEPANCLAAVPFSGGVGQILAAGACFYASPRLSPSGETLCWLQWDHPNLPWDGTELWLSALTPQGGLNNPRQAAGGPQISIFQPEWSPAGRLHFVSDQSGWWNLYRLQGDQIQPLFPMQAEFGLPQWVFGQKTYAFLAEEDILCLFTQNGLWKMGRLNLSAGQMQTLDLPFTAFSDLQLRAGKACFLAGSPASVTALFEMEIKTGRLEVVRPAFEISLPTQNFSLPQPVEFPTENGQSAHGLFYPPVNPGFCAPAGELPPLLVLSHGGPTSAARSLFSYSLQYWTSRGFAVLDVNYGGSTGYGRAYRMRLNGNWGITDVDDCCNGARWLAAQGRVDGKRMVISGGSAGGFTTLCALTFRQVFSAGASHYGISDLEALAKDTHKFESRYLDNLVGPYPQRRDLYLERSPIQHIERLTTPIILFQGDSDPVVPPNQSQAMFDAARQRGLPTAYLLFKDEQHGFRRAENIQRATEAEFLFYARVFGFEPADSIAPLKIENL